MKRTFGIPLSALLLIGVTSVLDTPWRGDTGTRPWSLVRGAWCGCEAGAADQGPA